jgi:hypothetical protein
VSGRDAKRANRRTGRCGRLEPAGLFAFTVETHDGDGVELGEKLRHRRGALQLRELAPVATRIESGGTVPGPLALATCSRDNSERLPS